MGTCYNFVCETCKLLYDLDKAHHACILVPNLLELHKGHEVFAYDDNNDDAHDRYEWSIGWQKPKIQCKEVKVWDGRNLTDEFKNLPLKWDESEFYHWLYGLEIKEDGK